MELVRTAYATFGRGDMGAMLELIHPGAISYTAAPLPDPAEHQGHDGFLQWVENWTSNFEQFRMEPQEFIDAGESVIVRVLQQGLGVESGVPVSQTFCLLGGAYGQGRVVCADRNPRHRGAGA